MITLKEAAKRYRHFMKEPDEIINIRPDTIIFPPGLTEEQKQNVIKICKQDEQSECSHCKFIENTFHEEIKSNYEYWIMTEVFVYLHDGKDYCNYGRSNVLSAINSMEKISEHTNNSIN